jgi:hypothetical protein
MAVAIRSMPKFSTNRASGIDGIRHDDFLKIWTIRFAGRENGAFRSDGAGAEYIGRQNEVPIHIECLGGTDHAGEASSDTAGQVGLARPCNIRTVYPLIGGSMP